MKANENDDAIDKLEQAQTLARRIGESRYRLVVSWLVTRLGSNENMAKNTLLVDS